MPPSGASLSQLREATTKFSSVRILCIGDLMHDRFVYGTVDRISPESPIPVMAITHEASMLGGVGNVVRGVLALGAQASLIAVIGDDTVGNVLTGLVAREESLVPTLLTERGRISTEKTRYVAASQQMLRADSETTVAVRQATVEKIITAACSEIAQHDAVILSDYGKGVLTAEVCHAIIQRARQENVPVFVDPKRRDVSIYRGATVLSPNARELALCSGEEALLSDVAMVHAATNLCAQHGFDYVLTTRGKEGMLLTNATGEVRRVAATAHEVFDVSGAGDTAIATLCVAHAAGCSMADAMVLANVAAGIAVGRLGTAVVHRHDVTTALFMLQAVNEQQKILPLEFARDMVARWRSEGLRIGFTNGCFDIMHAGHATVLADAKQHCDRLIVGVNADASVKRLKGESRPVNQEMDRAHLLAALSAVDMVVIFDDDTPLALIEALRPDVLMKGADYQKHQVVGHEIVESYGGDVVLLPLKEGYSTTGIIQKLVG